MATISVAGGEVKFTLGMWSLSGYIHRCVLVKQLLEIASDHVSPGTVYVDAEFDSIGTSKTLEGKELSYLIRRLLDNPVDQFVADIDVHRSTDNSPTHSTKL